MKFGIVSLVTMLVLFLTAAAVYSQGASDEQAARQVVENHMAKLQKTLNLINIKNLSQGKNIDVGGEYGKRVEKFLKTISTDAFSLEIKNYAIKDVSVEGDTAYVRVSETRKVGIKSVDLPGLDTGYKTVNETFVLERRNGQWKIDPLNTIHLTNLADLSQPDSIVRLINSMGLGRLSVLLEDNNLTAILQPLIGPIMQKVGVKTGGQNSDNPGNTTPVPDTTPTPDATPDTPPVNTSNNTTVTPPVNTPKAGDPKDLRNVDLCQTNLGYIQQMLTMYAHDNNGRFPAKLSDLKPTYLSGFPNCPAAGMDTYSAGYSVSKNLDRYTLSCSGAHHAKANVPAGYPRCSSESGPIPVPAQ